MHKLPRGSKRSLSVLPPSQLPVPCPPQDTAWQGPWLLGMRFLGHSAIYLQAKGCYSWTEEEREEGEPSGTKPDPLAGLALVVTEAHEAPGGQVWLGAWGCASSAPQEMRCLWKG